MTYSIYAYIGVVFQAYDYGRKGNLKRYGTKKPMEYHLDKITAPVYDLNNFQISNNPPFKYLFFSFLNIRFTYFREEMTELSPHR
jgi:hypothetical protein